MEPFLLPLLLLMQSSATPASLLRDRDEIYLTPEAVFCVTHLDLSRAYATIKNVEILIDKVKRTSMQSSPLTLYNAINNSNKNFQVMTPFLKHFLYNTNRRLDHIKTSAAQLGLVQPQASQGTHRYRRGAFNFLGEAGQYLFGLVSASQFEGLKDDIEERFGDIHTLDNSVSENRVTLNKVVKFLEKADTARQSSSSVFANCIQIIICLNSLERVADHLVSIKVSADSNHPNRLLIPEPTLARKLLSLSETHQARRPVFNSRQVTKYYKLQIAITSFNATHVSQIIRIPLIRPESSFRLEQKCDSGHICMKNFFGTAIIPLPIFLTCLGATNPIINTVCNVRPCVTAGNVVCRTLNVTTALVIVDNPTTVSVYCSGIRHDVLVVDTMAMTVPTNCHAASHNLVFGEVGAVQTLVTDTLTAPLPALLSGDQEDLDLSGTSLDTQTKHALQAMHLPEIQVKLRHTARPHHTLPLSISALSISGILSVALLTAWLLLRKKHAILIRDVSASISPNNIADIVDKLTDGNNATQ
jgi:hypothetical protein